MSPRLSVVFCSVLPTPSIAPPSVEPRPPSEPEPDSEPEPAEPLSPDGLPAVGSFGVEGWLSVDPLPEPEPPAEEVEPDTGVVGVDTPPEPATGTFVVWPAGWLDAVDADEPPALLAGLMVLDPENSRAGCDEDTLGVLASLLLLETNSMPDALFVPGAAFAVGCLATAVVPLDAGEVGATALAVPNVSRATIRIAALWVRKVCGWIFTPLCAVYFLCLSETSTRQLLRKKALAVANVDTVVLARTDSTGTPRFRGAGIGRCNGSGVPRRLNTAGLR